MIRKRLFSVLTSAVCKQTKIVLIGSLIVTAFMIFVTTKMSFNMDFAKLLPQDLPEVKSILKITEDFGTSSCEFFVIESKSKDVEQMTACADKVAEKLLALTYSGQGIKVFDSTVPPQDTINILDRVEYKVDRDFIRTFGFLMQKERDLSRALAMYSSLHMGDLLKNINDNFEAEYIDDQKNLSSFDGETRAVYGLEGIYSYVKGQRNYLQSGNVDELEEGIDLLLQGPKYTISPDNSLLILKMVQSPSIGDNFAPLNAYAEKVKKIIQEMEVEYPDLELGATGQAIFMHDIMESNKKDFGIPNLIAVLLILFLLVGAFGSWKNPFLAIVTLLVSLVWSLGMIALIIHQLNFISIIFILILFGLGIDFGIHFISGFRDGLAQGKPMDEAVLYMYEKYGTGVITGAFTTAFAFLTLALTKFDVLAETGLACGISIFTCLIAMLVVLPALLVWYNKGYSLSAKLLRKIGLGFLVNASRSIYTIIGRVASSLVVTPLQKVLTFSFLEKVGSITQRVPVAVGVILVALLLSVVSFMSIKTIPFDYNMMNLEAKGIMSAVNQDKILDKFNMSPDVLFILASNLEECRTYVDELKAIGDKTDLIGRIDAISEFIPNEFVQVANRETLQSFKKQLLNLKTPRSLSQRERERITQELTRLHKNIVEIGELSIASHGEHNNIVQKCDEIVGKEDQHSFLLAFAKEIKETTVNPARLDSAQLHTAMIMKTNLLDKCNDTLLTIGSLPQSIQERYVSPKTGSLLLTLYSRVQIFDEQVLNRFLEQIQGVSGAVTSTAINSFLFLRLMITEGRAATIWAIIAITLFLLIDFRSLTYTIFAIIPLIIGASWMFGAMALLDMSFNFNNLMAFPLILGIGIDDGVHMLHRYLEEGKGSMRRVMKYTGRAILLTSLTTIIAFGVMALGSRRGIASFGLVIALGVAFCFITSVFVLPAIVTLYERIAKK